CDFGFCVSGSGWSFHSLARLARLSIFYLGLFHMPSIIGIMAYRNPDEPFFHALLTPHRSLGPKGFRILMAMMIAISLGCGLLFLSLGAWPVFGFLGLDLALIYWAFRANYRSGRAQEEIFVSRTCLDIRQTSPKGEMVEHRFNP